MSKMLTLFMFSMFALKSHAQSSAAAFGAQIFDIFKNDSLAKLQKLRLTAKEVPAFLASNNIDTTSRNIQQYLSKYPSISSTFYKRCADIENDSLTYFPWKLAELIEATAQTNEPEVTSSYVNIKIKCREKEYLLMLEVVDYKGKWLLGNSITCFLIGDNFVED